MSALLKDSLILVTGASGYIGSHVVDQALKASLRVRIAVRSAEKGDHVKAYFEDTFPGKIEYVVVEDMAVDGAYMDAVKDVAGIIHVASILPGTTVNPTYNSTVKTAVAGTVSILKAAVQEPSVKRVVVTSSSAAGGSHQPDGPSQHWDATTWNNTTATEDETSDWKLYIVSKIEAERAAWDFVKANQPSFVLNTILPNANFGRVFPGFGSSTGGWIRELALGRGDSLKTMNPQWFINVSDTALLHVLVLLDASILNERVWAVTAPYSWNDILQEIRKTKPNSPVPDGFFGEWGNKRPNTTINFDRAKALMTPYGGLKNLEVTIRETLEDL